MKKWNKIKKKLYWNQGDSTYSKRSLRSYIVGRYCGEKLASVANQTYLTDQIEIADHIIHHYGDNPSIWM